MYIYWYYKHYELCCERITVIYYLKGFINIIKRQRRHFPYNNNKSCTANLQSPSACKSRHVCLAYFLLCNVHAVLFTNKNLFAQKNVFNWWFIQKLALNTEIMSYLKTKKNCYSDFQIRPNCLYCRWSSKSSRNPKNIWL